MRAVILSLACLLTLAHGSFAANIRAVKIEGLRQLSEEPLLNGLAVRPGQVYTEADANQAKDWLLDRGLFIKVELEVRTVGQVVDLVYQVVENPLVRMVTFEGNTELSAAALRPLLLTKPRQTLSRLNLWHDANMIGREYVKLGLRVAVEAAFEPEPTKPEPPVTVSFKVTELRFGNLVCEPLDFVRADRLQAVVILQPGELLRDERLGLQQRALLAAGLFDHVSEPETVETDQPGIVNVKFNVVERNRPVLTTASLPMVDVSKLCRQAKLEAVEMHVGSADLETWYLPETIRDELARANAAAAERPNDGEAQYQRCLWLVRADQATPADFAKAQQVLAQAPDTPQTHLRRGQVDAWQRDNAAAAKEFLQALTDPATRVEAYQELLFARAADLNERKPGAVDAFQQTVLDGVDALAQMPQGASLETTADAFSFYYTALTMSGMNIGLKRPLRLDGPLGGRLVGAVSELYRNGVSGSQARRLGRLVVAVAFAAKSVGQEAISDDSWQRFLPVLETVRKRLLTDGLETAAEPVAWFFVGLADTLLNQPEQVRADALAGLAAQPHNERLIDLYLVSALSASSQQKAEASALKQLAAGVKEVTAAAAAGQLSGYPAALLLAKLHLGTRHQLPQEQGKEREAERVAAETAARRATQAAPDQPGGWWILGMSLLKGPQPAQALAPYQRLATLPQRPGDAAYALALAKLAAGDIRGGLAEFAQLGG